MHPRYIFFLSPFVLVQVFLNSVLHLRSFLFHYQDESKKLKSNENLYKRQRQSDLYLN